MYNPFKVSKGQALAATIGCIVLAIVLFVIGLGVLGWSALMWAAIYGGLWLKKLSRDQRIIAESQADTAKPLEIEPPLTNAGSSRLFVPPPVDRR
jgi:glucose uptake protein GlcU